MGGTWGRMNSVQRALIDRRRRHVFKRRDLEQKYRPAGRPKKGHPDWHVASPYGKAVWAYVVALRGFQKLCTDAEWGGMWKTEYAAAEKRAENCWLNVADLIEDQTSLNLGA
jgi:hypothetical protein